MNPTLRTLMAVAGLEAATQALPSAARKQQGADGVDRHALTANDPQRLKVAAHSMKGSVDSFAAKPAYEAAFRLESLGRSGSMAGAGDAFEVLKKELDRLMNHLTGLAHGAASRN